MSYLKHRRARVILGCFLIASLLLVGFSGIDLRVSGMFFDDGFDPDGRWNTLIQGSVTYFICLSLAAVVTLYLYNRFTKRNVCGVNGRKIAYLFLVLGLGAGVIVNGVFKEEFGRARPREIAEFGGSRQFTPAFVISHECDSNCSFSSGDGAGAFFSLSLALALSRRRAVLLSALAYGGLVSLVRVMSGAHFLSDVVVSFFVMLIAADVLYHYMVVPRGERLPRAKLEGVYSPS